MVEGEGADGDALVDWPAVTAGAAAGCYQLLTTKELAPGIRGLAWPHQRAPF